MAISGKFKKDELGNRMKSNYENRTRILLPRRTYTLIRVDGKAFHTYTKGCERPFDMGLIEDMNETAIHLCKNIQGAVIGFVQSDEISILMTDFKTHETDAWFDGNIQKIVSVSASLAASKFNQLRWMRYINERYNNPTKDNDPVSWEWFEGMRRIKLADFDARTFTIPSKSEVMNYFIWRQQDTVRNSIASVAQNLYRNHKLLEGENVKVQKELILIKGQNWDELDPMLKRGRFVFKKEYEITENLKGEKLPEPAKRTSWFVDECPTFTKNPEFLDGFIPEL